MLKKYFKCRDLACAVVGVTLLLICRIFLVHCATCRIINFDHLLHLFVGQFVISFKCSFESACIRSKACFLTFKNVASQKISS